MRTIDATLLARLASGTTTLARLIVLQLLNGTSLYLTDCDRDITVGSTTYLSGFGCTVSQIQLVLGTTAQSTTVDVLIDPAGVSSQLIESGALDNAQFTISVVDFAMPTLPAVVVYVGFVSQVSYKDRITASISGMPLLARAVSLAAETFSSNCRADLGDSRCKVAIDGLKATSAVTAVASIQRFTVADTSGAWVDGLVKFTSGANNGFSFEIGTSTTSGLITLKGLTPFTIAAGDTVVLYPGCDKTLLGGCTRYNNILNFRGEPYSIPASTATSGLSSATTVVDRGSEYLGSPPPLAG